MLFNCFKAIKHQLYPLIISLLSKEDFGSSKPIMDLSNCDSSSLASSSLSNENYSGSETELDSSYWESLMSLSSQTLSSSSSSLSDQSYSRSESNIDLSPRKCFDSSLSMTPVCNISDLTYSPSIDTDSSDRVSQYASLSSTNSPETSPHTHPTSSAYL